MRARYLVAPLAAACAVACSCALGCDLITGVGNLTFPADGGPASAGSPDGGSPIVGDGGTPGDAMPPSGAQLATSATLAILGMTTDGYVAYFDTAAGTLFAAGVEEPDGGSPPSMVPVPLGAADALDGRVDGLLVEFFPPASEYDAGASHVGTLDVWSSSMSGGAKVVGGNLLAPDLTNAFFTTAASADGRYVAYFGPVDPSGATAPLAVTDLRSGGTKVLVPSVDVLEDACEPRLVFSGAYLVASYCPLPAGGHVSSQGPDGGTNYDIGTISSFDPASGEKFALASDVSTSFAADPNGVAAIIFGPSGLVASPIAGDGGLVAIDTTATSGRITNDGATVFYTTASSALKRASTSAPADPLQLVASSFDFVDVLSDDGSWIIGGANLGSQAGTSDLYLASAQQPGSAITLSSATTGAVLPGNAFTADGSYALFFTGLGADGSGALDTYALGGGGGATSLASGAYWAQVATGSVVVFNANATGGKADLEWSDLSAGAPPTLAVSGADPFFLLTPAKDLVVYTYSAPGGSAGLWVLGLGAVCSGGGGGAISYYPPGGPKGSCSADEVSLFDSQCVAAGDADPTCAETQPISGPCQACLASAEGATSWGAVISLSGGGGILAVNNGGCFLQQGAVACGDAIEAQSECENNACSSEPDLDSFNTCTSDADDGACSCYVASASAACANYTSSPCFPDSTLTFQQGFEAIAPVMCE
jgi:hypothetical protein